MPSRSHISVLAAEIAHGERDPKPLMTLTFAPAAKMPAWPATKARSEAYEPTGARLSAMTAKPTPVDPVQAAFDNAPIGEPETDEERRMVAEGRANFARHGRTRTPEQIRATIEEMRRKQEGE